MSSGHQSAPAGYQPTGQPQSDASFQAAANQLQQIGSSLPGQVIPGYQQVLQNVQNNPYAATAQAGANQVAAQGQGVSQADLAAATGLQALGQSGGYLQTAGAAGLPYAPADLASTTAAANQDLATTNALLPSTTGGAALAPGVLSQLEGAAAPGGLSQLQQGMSAADQVLNTAFDPQQALYDRTQQQVLDQQNAINAMNGVQGPYAAGLSGDATRNFNIDWQNQQLQRQISGLGAFGAEQGQTTGDLTNLINSGVSDYTGLTSNTANNAATLIGSGANAASNLIGAGVNANSALNQTAQAGFDTNVNANIAASTAAGNLSAQGLDVLSSSSAAPSNAYITQQNQQLQALDALTGGTAAATQPLQSAINAQAQYLGLGQSATRNAQQAAVDNNQANSSFWNGVFQGIGTIAAVAAGPFTGGASLVALPALAGPQLGGGSKPAASS